jgi:hypothetical protein
MKHALIGLYLLLIGSMAWGSPLQPAMMIYHIGELYLHPSYTEGIAYTIPGNLQVDRVDAVLDKDNILWVQIHVRNSLLIKIDTTGWIPVAKMK